MSGADEDDTEHDVEYEEVNDDVEVQLVESTSENSDTPSENTGSLERKDSKESEQNLSIEYSDVISELNSTVVGAPGKGDDEEDNDSANDCLCSFSQKQQSTISSSLSTTATASNNWATGPPTEHCTFHHESIVETVITVDYYCLACQ